LTRESTKVRLIDSAAVAAQLDYAQLVEFLRDAFREGAVMPRRSIHAVPDRAQLGSLLCMPAWSGNDLMIVKLVTAYPANAQRGLPTISGLVVIFDALSGQPVAVCDGTELTRRRTAAASALAATYLARVDSHTLTILGTGALAPYMAEAFCRVRPIERVRVWGRDASKAEAVCLALRQRLPVDVTAVLDPREAVRSSDIVSCCTSAPTPILFGDWLRPGTHVDAVGSYQPTTREIDDEVVVRSAIYVDRIDDALEEAGDILIPLRDGLITRQSIRGDLHALARGLAAGRMRRNEITLFKSVGNALEDLAAARCLLSAQRVASSPGTF
jgi:ornithine cyclodeaminase/alanine dehydrogenase-like protein (mu-crystallin family)